MKRTKLIPLAGAFVVSAIATNAAATEYQEAECPHHGTSEYDPVYQGATQGHPNIETHKDGYFGNGYIEAKTSYMSPTVSNPNEVAYHFQTQAGQYKLYLRVNTDGNGGQDSFYVTQGHAHNANWQTVNNLSSLGWGWNWAYVGEFTLGDGESPFTIRSREAGLSIDRLALVPVGQAAPSGVGGRAYNCSTQQVACNDSTCSYGQVCCDNGDDTYSCSAEAQCPWRYSAETPISCDSHLDCAAGELCTYVNQGGNEIITCVNETSMYQVHPSGPTIMMPICSAGESAQSACPAPWGSCEELVNENLEIMACELQF